MSAQENGVQEKERTATGVSPASKFVYVLTLFATFGGFLFGYDTGIVSGSMLLIGPYFHLDTAWTEVIVSGTLASAACFSLLGGYSMDCMGRRRTIMVSSAVFTIGAVILCSASAKESLLVGRLVVGIAIGFSAITVPVYIAEMAPTNIRGTLLCSNQLCLTMGILVSSIVAGIFGEQRQTGWRYMLGLSVVPAVVQFVGFIFLPETPRWLMDHGLEIKARAVLVLIRGTSDVEEEMMSIRQKIMESKTTSALKSNGGSNLLKLCSTPHVRRALFVGCMLQFFQQVCGVNTVIYYSASIMKMAGFSVTHAIWLVVAPNSVNLVSTIIGMYLIDRWGRKKLLLTSLAGVFVAVAILAIGFQLSAIYAPPINVIETLGNRINQGSCNTKYSSCDTCTSDKACGFCYDVTSNGSCLPVDLWIKTRSLVGRCNVSDQSGSEFTFASGYCPNGFTWMPVIGMVLYVFFFAPGLGPVTWAVNSEIYPLWARGTCMAIAATTNWVMNLIVSLTFLTLTETITKYGTFWLFGGMCILGFVFVLIFLPETKNKNLEEVEQLFMSSGSRLERLHLLQAQSWNTK